ncbi:Ubiquitin-conjugating enzyme E2 G1 [Cucumispora dikerogammari]|nr:Ubiquitin-conjugating enzyme E2 G1 [Cucumispora dikerogammari]
MRKHESLLHLKNDFIFCQSSNDFSIGLDNNDYYRWNVLLFGSEGTLYENGLLKGIMEFPFDYPNSPPTFRFTTPMWHPNIDKKGVVCISILHAPGDDIYGYENANERWSCVLKPDTILISILSLLHSPNEDSPANVDAAKEYIKNREMYNRRVRKLVEDSMESVDDL